MLKLFACAIVFASWAIVTALGVTGSIVTAVFLALVSCALVVAERERMKQRQRR